MSSPRGDAAREREREEEAKRRAEQLLQEAQSPMSPKIQADDANGDAIWSRTHPNRAKLSPFQKVGKKLEFLLGWMRFGLERIRAGQNSNFFKKLEKGWNPSFR